MAWQEKYYYRNDPKYSEEEIKQIDKILKKEDNVTAVFVPIVSILFFFMIPCLIMDIIFHLKALEIALYVLMCLFFIALFLWFIFYYKVSQERIKIMMEIEKDKKKKEPVKENFDYEQIKKKIDSELHLHFKPEFLNRIDEIIIFKRLEKQDIGKIIDIQLKTILKRLADKKISIELSEKAKDFLADKGYEPAFGARPLKRALQTYLLNPLSSQLIAGNFAEGSKIKVDLNKDNSELKFTK